MIRKALIEIGIEIAIGSPTNIVGKEVKVRNRSRYRFGFGLLFGRE